MMIKDFGARVESVWQGLRPMTKKMIVGALQNTAAPVVPPQKYSYDVHAEWELSRLLAALEEQSREAEIKKDQDKSAEIQKMSETVAGVLEAQTESAEVFIQLAERILRRSDYARLDSLSDILSKRFSAAEIAEIVRQTETAQIRAIAYETLSLMPTSAILNILDDPLYEEIAFAALEQQAFEYEIEEAREVLEQLENEE